MASRSSVGHLSGGRFQKLIRRHSSAAAAESQGDDGSVQYNNDGAFGGASGIHYIDTDARGTEGYVGFGVTGASVTHRITLPDTAGTQGRILANAYNTYSTRRLKKNIRNIEDPIAMVMNMRGVFFDWKKSGIRDIGFIAEEVGGILPEIVDFDDNGTDARSMDYARITPLLLECVKQQQKKIENLENKIISLERLTHNDK